MTWYRSVRLCALFSLLITFSIWLARTIPLVDPIDWMSKVAIGGCLFYVLVLLVMECWPVTLIVTVQAETTETWGRPVSIAHFDVHSTCKEPILYEVLHGETVLYAGEAKSWAKADLGHTRVAANLIFKSRACLQFRPCAKLPPNAELCFHAVTFGESKDAMVGVLIQWTTQGDGVPQLVRRENPAKVTNVEFWKDSQPAKPCYEEPQLSWQ